MSWMYSAMVNIGSGSAEIRQRRSTHSDGTSFRRHRRELGKQFGFHSRRYLATKKTCMKLPQLYVRFRSTRKTLLETVPLGVSMNTTGSPPGRCDQRSLV